jgi:8-oxo-dGTP diphosphatase
VWQGADVSASPTPRLIVAAALVDDLAYPTRLLAARRRRPPAFAGRWELPGGKVDSGESPVGGLHRELAEELGIQVQLGEPLPGPLPDATWPLVEGLHMAVWWAVASGYAGQADGIPEGSGQQLPGGAVHGIPQPGEVHDEVRWLTREQLWEVPWLDPDIPIVHAIAVHLPP